MTNLLGRRRGSRWRFGTKTAKNFRGRLISIGNKPYIDPPVDEVDDGNDTGAAASSIRSRVGGGSRRNPNLPQMEFVENQVKSSRYTILTFLPK